MNNNTVWAVYNSKGRLIDVWSRYAMRLEQWKKIWHRNVMFFNYIIKRSNIIPIKKEETLYFGFDRLYLTKKRSKCCRKLIWHKYDIEYICPGCGVDLSTGDFPYKD